MIRVEKLLFPGTIAGCLFLVLVTSLISRPGFALASNIAAAPPAVEGAAVNLAAAAASLDEALPVVPVVATPLPPQEVKAPEPTEAGSQQENEIVDEPAAVEQNDQPVEPAADTTCAVSASYPESVLQWCALISEYSVRQGLDPNLVAAVIQQESAGNPDAYSKSGAVGLMQVMPRDGLASSFMCINGPCFAARPSMDELFDPEFNVAYGTRMLAGLVSKHGSVREALYAYGPMNMGYRYADIVLDIYERHR